MLCSVAGTGGDMHTNESGATSGTVRFDRRSVVQAIGAGAVLATLGTGSVLAGDDEERDETDGTDESENDSWVDRSGDDVHPVFGFSALTGDVEFPVEPDHTVDAYIAPRDDREIPEFYFEPTGLALEPGETVQFQLVTPHHSVTAFHPALGIQQRVPDGVPPFSSPVLPVGASWLYTFEEPGVYDVHCGPHELFGHVARLVVGEASGPGAEPIPEMANGHGNSNDENGNNGGGNDENGNNGDGNHENGNDENGADEDESGEAENGPPEPRPPVGAAVTVLNDPALEPDRILEEGQVSWDEIDDANKAIEL